jgi:membrane protein implicated in regulation of membrane protease activity
MSEQLQLALIWVGVAVVAGIIEVTTLNLLLAMIAGGALVAALFAVVGAPAWLTGIVFAGASGALLLLARPALLGYLRRTAPAIPMHTAALVGQSAVVLTPITAESGTIRLAGDLWTARTEPGAAELEVEQRVRVVRIDGATAIVAGLEP